MFINIPKTEAESSVIYSPVRTNAEAPPSVFSLSSLSSSRPSILRHPASQQELFKTAHNNDSVDTYTASPDDSFDNSKDEEGALGPSRNLPTATASRRTRWIVICSIVAATLVVAIAVVMMVLRRSLFHATSKSHSNSGVTDQTTTSRTNSTITTSSAFSGMWFPEMLGGTGLNGRMSASGRVNHTYDQLLAFGSSYSDNAHWREPIYEASYAPVKDYWERRWSNGPIWVEYLRDLLGNSSMVTSGTPFPLHGYAYGGATTDNQIHNGTCPDTNMQMEQWKASPEFSAKSKALVTTFTSTNDVTKDFRDFLLSTTPVWKNETEAMKVINESAQALVTSLLNLVPAQGVAPDFLILPVVPLEDTPIMREVAKALNATTDVCRQLTEQYNTVLMDGAAQVAQKLGSRGNVFTYDVPTLIHTMVQDPQTYGITNVTAGCSQWGCANADTYIFWDHLHLTTSLQKNLADSIFAILQN